jgi:transposase
LGTMSPCGMIATMTIEEATDTDIFLAYLDHVLCPQLRPGDVVVMDNLSSHKVRGVRERIESAGAELLYLPPYSPDLTRSRRHGRNSNYCFARPKRAQRDSRSGHNGSSPTDHIRQRSGVVLVLWIWCTPMREIL